MGRPERFGGLTSMSDDELVGLLERRPDLTAPVPRSLRDLAARAETWASLQRCLLSLDSPAHQLLHVLCLLPAGSPLEAAAGLLGPVPAAALTPVAERLRALGLAWGPDTALHVSAGIRSALSYPASLGRPVEVLLDGRAKRELELLARALSLPPTGSKGTLVQRLAQHLSDPAVIDRLVAKAPAGARQLLEDLDHHPVCDSPFGFGSGGRRSTTPAGWLSEHALVVQTSWSTVEMPREVGLARRGGVAFRRVELDAPATGGDPVAPEAVAAAAVAAGEAVLADLGALLRTLGDSPAALLKSGGVGVRECKRLARAADLPESGVPRLLELAHAAGLVAAGNTHAAPTPAFDGWSSSAPVVQWLTLVEAWRGWQGEPALAGQKGDDGKVIPALDLGSVERAAPTRRTSFLAALAAAPPHHAPPRAELVRAAVWAAPMSWPSDESAQLLVAGWLAEEAELLGLTGRGALAAPARALLAGDVERAEAEAAALLSSPVATFTVQADLTAVSPPNLDPDIRAELALLATVESSGGATVWRFDEASIGRSLDAGRTAGEIVGFLEAHATKGVPQALAYLVADTARRHGSVRVGGVASYVRSDDPALVAQVLRMRRASSLGLRQLAPTVVVSKARPAELVAALRAGGLLAVAEAADGAVEISRPAPVRAAGQHTVGGTAPALDEVGRRRLVAELRAAPPEPAVPSRPAGSSRRATAVASAVALEPSNVLALFGDRYDDDLEVDLDRSIGPGELDVDELLELLDGAESLTLTYRDGRGREQTVTGLVVALSDESVLVLPFGGQRPREVPVVAIEWIELLTDDLTAPTLKPGGRR